MVGSMVGYGKDVDRVVNESQVSRTVYAPEYE